MADLFLIRFASDLYIFPVVIFLPWNGLNGQLEAAARCPYFLQVPQYVLLGGMLQVQLR